MPAGTNGAINVFVWNPTDVIIDINGYFAPSTLGGNEFFTVTPCRISDTRSGAGYSGQFGPPQLAANASRTYYPWQQSYCGLPSSATAYSLNFTVVPPSSDPPSNLTVWPTGSAEPNVSTLNYSNFVIANAAIVPTGSSGGINVAANNPTDLLFDTNGYFASPTTGGLHFYTLPPCRIADTRTTAGFSGQFGPPSLSGGQTRNFPLYASSCGIPTTAIAFSLNFTVVPNSSDPPANLTVWPGGIGMPNVSTLNFSTSIIANSALVPAGTGGYAGQINVFANYPTDVIIDINGYFAP